MPSGTYTISALSRKPGDVIAEALKHPITIKWKEEPELVLMSAEDFKKMRAKDTRQVWTLETMPDSLFDELEEAMNEYLESEEK